MIIRNATRADLPGIGQLAEAAYWACYEGLIRPDTIGRVILRDFSPAAAARRLLRGGVFVAMAGEEIAGFVDGDVGIDVVHVRAIATDRSMRRRGVGTALLAATRGLAPDVPAAADVLLGNLEGERFYEVNGFVPGEIRHGSLFGEDVIERRWWREAAEENLPTLSVAADS